MQQTTQSAIEFGVEETARRLRDSLATLEWAVANVPARWTHALPDYVDPAEWTVARILAHVAVYEESAAAPVLEEMAAGRDGSAVKFSGEGSLAEAEALAREPLDVIMARLRAARQRQIAAVTSFNHERINAPLTPLWSGSGRHGGPLQPAGWVATKTFQHTWEHGNTVLRVALFAPR
jgi:hypothetical protein